MLVSFSMSYSLYFSISIMSSQVYLTYPRLLIYRRIKLLFQHVLVYLANALCPSTDLLIISTVGDSPQEAVSVCQ